MHIKQALTSTARSAAVAVPAYNRHAAPPAIVHFGVGNFVRAHLCAYTDAVLNQQSTTTTTTSASASASSSSSSPASSLDEPFWGIHGVGVLDHPAEATAAATMADQDCLFGLMTMPSGRARVIGSIVKYDHCPSSKLALASAITALAAPTTRIASLTVTEKGYFQEPATGDLDFARPEVQHDIALIRGGVEAALRDNRPCQTALGQLVAGLAARHQAGQQAGGAPPITLLSCDNLPGNGGVLRRLVGQLTQEAASGPSSEGDLAALAEWVATPDCVTFPSSMVDRITPATTPAVVSQFEAATGIADAWPVIAEDFAQWVVEDDFVAGRPNWEAHGVSKEVSGEDGGVLFVPDVEPFEEMKLRLLNGSHTALSYISVLAGHERVDGAMADPKVLAFTRRYMDCVTHTVPSVPGVDVEQYKATYGHLYIIYKMVC